jgi:PAS domain S-box-containing protein
MEQLFETLCLAADGAYIIDDRQRIIFWNESAATLLGYDADEVIGRQCYQIFGGRDDQG